MSAKPFPLPILIDLIRERIEVTKQYEQVARIGCLGELMEQAVAQLERLRKIEEQALLDHFRRRLDPEPSFWQRFRDNWRLRRAERKDTRDLQGEALVNELGRMAR